MVYADRSLVGVPGLVGAPQHVQALSKKRQGRRVAWLSFDRLAQSVDGQVKLAPLHVVQRKDRFPAGAVDVVLSRDVTGSLHRLRVVELSSHAQLGS